MKVLIVCSGNIKNTFAISQSFIKEQADSLSALGITYDTFLIKGSNASGYLRNFPRFKKQLAENRYDVIHAHYGLSGLFANLQRKIPVITTFHGSDVWNRNVRFYSFMAHLMSKKSIFVHPVLPRLLGYRSGSLSNFIVPCGVDMNTFSPIDKYEARKRLKLAFNKKYILFSSSFETNVKNAPLAFNALKCLKGQVPELLELKGYGRNEVNFLLNAVDVVLVASFRETGPLIVKEAMACNCPIVSTDVGDVRAIIRDTEGCYITSFDPEDVAAKIKLALDFNKRTNGREKIRHLDNRIIAEKIVEIYKSVLKKGT